MNQLYDLSRFVRAHQRDYTRALAEIRNGYKETHWMWYIFPQLKGLGMSERSQYYGIADLDEAKAYLAHPYLGAHMEEICRALLALDCSDPRQVMGPPDDKKLRSSMTLFTQATEDNALYLAVLDKFFRGRQDRNTLDILSVSGQKP